MDRITGKKIRPPLTTPADDARVVPRRPDRMVPPTGRLMAGSESMTPSQREHNRQLIALYHAMRNAGPTVGTDLANSTIRGWTKRSRREEAARTRGASRSARTDRAAGDDVDHEADEED